MCGPICRTLWVGTLALFFCAAHAWSGEAPTPKALAPGVLTVIPPDANEEETNAGPVPIVEIVTGMSDLDWSPNYSANSETLLGQARNVVFRRPVWCLEFAFKPVRMIEVDIPQPSGKMQRKLHLVPRLSGQQ